MVLRKEFNPSIIALFRRRVLAQAERNRRLLRFQAELKHTTAALQEVTGMSEDEVNACYESVQRELAFKSDRFFSVPQQLALVTITVILMFIGACLISYL